MATTHVHHTTSPRRAAGRLDEESTSYAAVWGLLALAIIAAVAYGYYSNDRQDLSTVPVAQSSDVTPDRGGTIVPMDDTTARTNGLTPSVLTPGTPDTTTTESTSTPTQSVAQ